MSWLGIKAKFAMAGSLLLAGITFFFRLQYLKGKAERQERRADTLAAQLGAEKIKRKIEKEEREKLFSRRKELIKTIKEEKEKKEEGSPLTGLPNFNEPNDY